MRLFLLLAVCATSLPAQQTQLESDAKTLLLAVREKVMQTVNRLPRYMCTETIDRATFLPDVRMAGASCDTMVTRGKKGDWKIRKDTSDRLRLDVAVSSLTEMFSWAGEERFGDSSLSELVGGGATSTGAFSAFLTSIFGTQAASFTYEGDVNTAGRTLSKFGYRVPINQSEYHINQPPLSFVVPYDGTFLVDPRTSDLVSLTVRANQLPPELHACEDTTIMNYSRVQLNSAEFLLPKDVTLQVLRSNGSQLQNRTMFSGCHEFLGKSSLSFDVDGPSEEIKAAQKNAHPLDIPPGLAFHMRLRHAIETATAAAGDPIEAELKSALKGPGGAVLAPKGAVIAGRVVQVKRTYGPESELLTVLIRVKTIEVGGVPQRFDVRLQKVVQRRPESGQALTPRLNLGRFDQIASPEDPGLGELDFQNVSSNYVIERGFEMQGETAPHPPTP